MKDYLNLFVILALTLTPFKFTEADHYDSVFDAYDMCVNDCEDNRDQSLQNLDCNYYGTQSAHQVCVSRASSVRISCLNRCDQAEDETISNCKSTYRENKKECRRVKKEETKECKDARRSENTMCKQSKIDENEACKQLSGRAKRDCKIQARQNKRDCKEQARETMRICKQESRDDNINCKDTARETRNSCIFRAERQGRECRSVCNDAYEAACVEERQAANACASQAEPIFFTESICKEVCDDNKENSLEGYNSSCSNNHAGDRGATITFYNASREVRHYYRPEPYPETRPLGPLYLNMEYVTSLNPGESYEQQIACGITLTFHFKQQRTDGSNFTGQTFNVGPYPCCEEEDKVNLVIDE